MTHKIKLSAVAGAVVLALGAQSALAASENANAEFAAVYSEAPIVLVPYGDREVSNYAYCKAEYLGVDAGEASCDFEAARRTGTVVASIKVAQSKELLVGVSAQMEIFTGTTVTGKRGSRSTAIASAGGGVELMACRQENDGGATCYGSLSGMIVLSERSQELTAVLGGVLEQCNVDLTTGNFSLADCDVAQEEIGLGLSTIASHHYNFLFPNLPVGTYNVHAVFHADAAAEAIAGCADGSGNTDLTGCGLDDGTDASAEADAYVVISKSTVTVQEVRAKKVWDLTPIEM